MIKIGDKVVYVRTHPEARHSVTKGLIYTIAEIIKCPNCGALSYRLEEGGAKVPPPYIATTVCGCDTKISLGYYVFDATRFRPVEYLKLSYSDIAKQHVEERLDVPVRHNIPA